MAIDIIQDESDEKYVFAKFDKDVKELEVGDGNSMNIHRGDFVFIQYKAIKRMLNEDVCHVI